MIISNLFLPIVNVIKLLCYKPCVFSVHFILWLLSTPIMIITPKNVLYSTKAKWSHLFLHWDLTLFDIKSLQFLFFLSKISWRKASGKNSEIVQWDFEISLLMQLNSYHQFIYSEKIKFIWSQHPIKAVFTSNFFLQ